MKIREEARPLAHRNPSFMPKLSRFQRNERLANANHYVVARVPGIPDAQAAPILPIRPPNRKLKFPLSQKRGASALFTWEEESHGAWLAERGKGDRPLLRMRALG